MNSRKDDTTTEIFEPVLSEKQTQDNISEEKETDVSELFSNTIEQEEPKVENQYHEKREYDDFSEMGGGSEGVYEEGSKNESLAKTAQVILENSSKFLENLLFGVPSSKCHSIKQGERNAQEEAIREYLDSVNVKMTPLQKLGASVLPMFAFSIADGLMKNSQYEGGLYDKWTKGKKHRAKKAGTKTGEKTKSTGVVRRRKV